MQAPERRGVLIVNAPYPQPAGAAGAAGVRAQALARGLRARGHAVTVVAAGPDGRERSDDDGVEVVRARYLDVEGQARRAGLELRELHRPRGDGAPARTGLAREVAVRLCVPDRYVVWVPGAVAAARNAGAPHDVVLSTGPVSAHLVARAVVGRRPWLVDCNDLWSRNPDRSNGPFRDRVDDVLEAAVLRRATQLTTVNEPMRAELERRHRKPVTVLPSGFDAHEFPPLAGPPPGNGAASNGQRRLVYAGTLYGNQDLSPLLGALAEGRRAGRLDPERLHVSFHGRLCDRAALEAERFGVGDFVEATEPIPRPELLARMIAADALLMPLYATDPNALPMKLYEYVGAARPIIAFGPGEHLAARVVADQGLGVRLHDAAGVERCLEDLVAGHAALPAAAGDARERFGREASLRLLAGIVDEL